MYHKIDLWILHTVLMDKTFIALQDDLLRLNEAFVNRRIESHAQRINIMEYPTYQELMNLYVKRHLYLHQMVERQWHTLQDAHSAFYCHYLRNLDPKADCSQPMGSMFGDAPLSACEFEQVRPNFYWRWVRGVMDGRFAI